jgi:dienelactone hydrolase
LPGFSAAGIVIPPMKSRVATLVVQGLLTLSISCFGATSPLRETEADLDLAGYFRAETARLAGPSLTNIRTLEDWTARHEPYRQQLFEMLSLTPLPPRGDLKPVVTGRIVHEQFTVENLHFQSLPGLYVTANLYLPKDLARPAPAILYLCGHGPVISNNVSYGNKVSYQHHGIWFARNGYVCLILDTVQLGEILGLHHGTYREGMWWWNARGFTPAGVEAWNSVRALDYLATRPEVDPTRFGVTGRSGGGAYSWWLAALDDRIKAAAPVAGITDLQNHVVDGAVEGHCDCMFMVNTYRWDYPQVAALVAPRPLLLVNTDSDTIFPLDGVLRTHSHLRHIYRLYNASNQLGLVIGPGPHKDTQDLQVPVFRWFNKHLKGEDPVIDLAAVKLFKPEQLKVFDQLPADAINTNIHASFVPLAPPRTVPDSAAGWQRQRDEWLAALKAKSFAGWPEDAGPVELKRAFSAERHSLRFQAFDFTSQPHVSLRLYAVQRAGRRMAGRALLHVATTAEFSAFASSMRWGFPKEWSEEIAALRLPPPGDETAFATLQRQLETNSTIVLWFAPRGLGLTAWSGDARKLTQIRRRFMLLGQTLDGMRVWDIRRAVQAVRSVEAWRTIPLRLEAQGDLAVDALYASLFEPGIAGLELRNLPPSQNAGPDLLNVLRILDLPQAVAMAAERCPVRLEAASREDWVYPIELGRALRWRADQFVVASGAE